MRTPDNRLGSTPTAGQLRAAEKNEAAAYDPPIQEVRVSLPTALPSDPSQKKARVDGPGTTFNTVPLGSCQVQIPTGVSPSANTAFLPVNGTVPIV